MGAVAQQHGAAAAELAAELLPLAQRYVLASGRRQGLGLDQVRGRDSNVLLRQLDCELMVPSVRACGSSGAQLAGLLCHSCCC